MIFVMVLTIGYIAYYGYHIYRDLQSKKIPGTEDEESFDLSLADEEAATPVSETAGGFQVGTKDNDGTAAVQEPEHGGTETVAETQDNRHAEEKARKLQEALYEARVQDELELNEREFAEMLQTRGKRGELFREESLITTPEKEITV